MKVRIKFLSGARAGTTVVLSTPSIEIGRHPSSNLRFDPDEDLEVSARHATLFREGDRWFIRDEGSLNGTLVNGHAITGKTALDDTDQIRLGPEGPIVEFRLVSDSVPDGPSDRPTGAEARRAARGSAEPSAYAYADAGVTQRVRLEVDRQTRRLRALTVSLVAVLLLVTAVFIYDSIRQRGLHQREVAAAEARTDSILQAANDAIEALQGRVAGLATTLTASQEEVERLQSELAGARQTGSAEQVEQLRRQLADASQALLYQQAAAYLDYRGIADANQRAVALIWVEFDPGEVYVGTAFAVRPDGVLITSRHVVAGAAGDRRPAQIAVKFADSYQVYRARVLTVSPDADVAALKVDIPGGVPTVRRLNLRADTLGQGDPVAIIGFPLGPDLPMTALARDRTVARTSFSAGSVSKMLDDVVQVDGYGAGGSSGSPIFDRNGEVIGVVYGGEQGSYGRVVLGVPSQHVMTLLESIERQ
ncbi:MAG: trypsin-like peptidase domain-containing protein [Gemmatimonadota bacterium]|nr:MAG: trypsin-like peptidase domain-containing protein [Gemmatimonadota bacterium]